MDFHRSLFRSCDRASIQSFPINQIQSKGRLELIEVVVRLFGARLIVSTLAIFVCVCVCVCVCMCVGGWSIDSQLDFRYDSKTLVSWRVHVDNRILAPMPYLIFCNHYWIWIYPIYAHKSSFSTTTAVMIIVIGGSNYNYNYHKA